MHLAVFDFDGTLFASPQRPSWWPFQGFWGRPESLSPPHVPERPGGDWWAPGVVAAAKRAISDPDTYVVLLTGRPPKLSHRIKDLLHGAGLRFDEYHFSNDDTLTFKLRVIEALVGKIEPVTVTLWEDREEHVPAFKAKLKDLGTDFKVHEVPRVTREFEETTPFRVASRWQDRLADAIGDLPVLIQQFEKVIEQLAVLEKDIPWMQEMEELWKKAEAAPKQYPGQDADDWLSMTGNPNLKRFREYWAYRFDFALKVKFSSGLFSRVRAPYLFLGILQQYELPPRTRKAVEAAAKYHSKARKIPSKEAALGAYMKMMAELRGQLAAAKDALAHGKPHGAGGDDPAESSEATTQKAGPFRLVNTGGFDAKTMAEVAGVVEKSAALLRGKGITQVLYGDILVSRTLSRQNVLAFYLHEKDEMFVRANLRGKQHDAVKTVCHELGHRLHFKFLKSKDQEIRGIYAQLARKMNMWDRKDKIQEVLKDHPILPGDTFPGKGGKVYEVTGTSWKGRGLVVDLQRKADAETRGFGELPPAPGAVEKAYIPLESYLMVKGLLSTQDLSAFVTAYAAKNHEENFAEMIAAWCQDKLPEDQVEMLKAVL